LRGTFSKLGYIDGIVICYKYHRWARRKYSILSEAQAPQSPTFKMDFR
jgi:hypothetical protein